MVPSCGCGSANIGIHYGAAFTGLTAVHTAEGTAGTVLAEVALPGPIRSQQAAYGIHPALLDACFQSLVAHPDVGRADSGGLLLPRGVRRLRAHQSTRNARFCLTRVTKVDAAGVKADLDVLDEHGTVLLTVQGLQLGTGVSESEQADRVLNKRLLTVEWQQQALPEVGHAEPVAWLLISTCDAADLLATTLTDALKTHDAKCTTIFWPSGADHPVGAAPLPLIWAPTNFTV